MSTSLIGSIDLNKIDKSKVKEVKLKDGSVAKFYDIKVVLKDEADQYGNHGFVSESVPKDSAEKGTILGNAKIAGQKPQPIVQTVKAEVVPAADDLPF